MVLGRSRGHFWGPWGCLGGPYAAFEELMKTLKEHCILLYFYGLRLIRDPCDAPGGDSESPKWVLGDTMAAFWDPRCTLGSLEASLGIPKRAMFGR